MLELIQKNLGSQLPLLSGDQVPKDLREIAILRGYRPPSCSVRQCLQSILLPTNETLNVWTHLIPTGYFWWRLGKLSQDMDIPSDPYTWPFAAYMVTVCIYPMASAFAHTFFSMSELARHVCFFVDYAALSLYGFGAGLLYRSYVFPDSLFGTTFSDVFLEVGAVLSLVCTVLACSSRFMPQCPGLTSLFRLGAFALPWTWDSGPLAYRLLSGSSPSGRDNLAEIHYAYQFAFSLLIGLFYATHLPERLAPGKFDVLGHSHQLLHICGVLASHHQLSGALHDLSSRRAHLEKYALPPRLALSCFSFIFLSNIIIVAIFACFASRCSNKPKGKIS